METCEETNRFEDDEQFGILKKMFKVIMEIYEQIMNFDPVATTETDFLGVVMLIGGGSQITKVGIE